MRDACESSFSENVGYDRRQLHVRHGQRVLVTVFFTGPDNDQFEAVAHDFTQIPNSFFGNETAIDHIVLKQVSNPDRVFLIGFLPPNSFDILGTGQRDFSG